MAWIEHPTPKRLACPHCGQRVTAEVTVTDVKAKAKPGDYAICAGCGSVMVWGGDMQLRAPTHEEARFASHSTAIRAIATEIRTRKGYT